MLGLYVCIYRYANANVPINTKFSIDSGCNKEPLSEKAMTKIQNIPFFFFFE
jgi:hypothetical protein